MAASDPQWLLSLQGTPAESNHFRLPESPFPSCRSCETCWHESCLSISKQAVRIKSKAGWNLVVASLGREFSEAEKVTPMIRKLKSGEYRLYSSQPDRRTGHRRNLGTFATRAAAEKHERAVQYFKRHG